MKNIIYIYSIFFFILFINESYAQEIRHVNTSNTFITLSDKGNFSIESSINLKSEIQFEANYLISDKIAIYGSYNFINWRNRRHQFLKGLFGGPNYDYVENKNSGYRFGVGFINLVELDGYKTEFLIDYETQNQELVEYYPTRPSEKDFIFQKYSKYNFQINLLQVNTNLVYGISVKTSYYKTKVLDNFLSDDNYMTDINLIDDDLLLFNVTGNFEYRLIKGKPFFITAQFGYAGAFDDFESNVNREGFWGFISKIGLKYKFL